MTKATETPPTSWVFSSTDLTIFSHTSAKEDSASSRGWAGMLQAPERLLTAMWLQPSVFRALELQQRLNGRLYVRCTCKMHAQQPAVSPSSHCCGGF